VGAEAATVSRAEIEDFLFREADLLDNWKLDDWLALLTDDAAYYVPPNDKPDADHRFTLFTVADDIVRLRERVIRLKTRTATPNIRRRARGASSPMYGSPASTATPSGSPPISQSTAIAAASRCANSSAIIATSCAGAAASCGSRSGARSSMRMSWAQWDR